MLKKPITFTNPLTDQVVTKNYYFNLTAAEIAARMMRGGSDYGEMLDNLVKESDGKKIIDTFIDIVGSAVGVRDGDDFRKNAQITETFLASEAYSVMFMEFLDSPDAASAWVNGVMPANLREEAKRIADSQSKRAETQNVFDQPSPEVPAESATAVPENRARDMSKEELQAAYTERLNQQAQRD